MSNTSDIISNLGEYIENRLDILEEKIDKLSSAMEQHVLYDHHIFENSKLLEKIKSELEHIEFLASEPINNEQYKIYIKWLQGLDDKSAEEKAKEADMSIQSGECSGYSSKHEKLKEKIEKNNVNLQR